jgi:hypothetical protein
MKQKKQKKSVKKRIVRKPTNNVFTALKMIEGYARKTGEWVNAHERKILLTIQSLLAIVAAYHYFRLDLERGRSKLDTKLVQTSKKQTQVTEKIYKSQEKVVRAAELQAKATGRLAMQQAQMKELQDMGLAYNNASAKDILDIKKQISKLKNKTEFVNKTLNSKGFKAYLAKTLKMKEIKKA